MNPIVKIREHILTCWTNHMSRVHLTCVLRSFAVFTQVHVLTWTKSSRSSLNGSVKINFFLLFFFLTSSRTYLVSNCLFDFFCKIRCFIDSLLRILLVFKILFFLHLLSSLIVDHFSKITENVLQILIF